MQNSSNGDTPPPIDAAEFSTLILQMTRNNHKLHGVAGYQWMHFLTQQLVKLDGHFRGDGHTYNVGDVKQAGVVELHTIALLLADMHFQAMYESVWTCLETAGVTHLPNSAHECRRHRAPQATFLSNIAPSAEALAIIQKDAMDVLHTPPNSKNSLKQKLLQVLLWYGLGAVQDPKDPFVEELAVTVQLVTLHKWRFSAIHAYVCGEQESPEGGLEEPGRAVLDLDRMMRLVYMSSALSENKSLRLDGMIQQVRDEIEDVTAALRNGEDVEIQRLGRSANCRAELSALHWSLIRELRGLENDLSCEGKALVQGMWWLYGEEFVFVMYLLAWANGLVLALYVTSLPHDIFDTLLAIFPVINGVHVAVEIVLCGGIRKYVLSADRKDRQSSRIGALVIVLGSLAGLLAMAVGAEEGVTMAGTTFHIEKNYQRTLVALTTLFVFTRSRYFSRMVKTMQKSLSVCWPFVLTALLSMLAFSTLCGFLYKDLGTAYFASTITSFFTAFQLSLGEGWDKVMWDVSHATNYATTLLFVVYVFFSTLLFGQLVLGVIIAVFVEADSFASSRVYNTLQPISGNLNEAEREALMEDFLRINYQLLDIHEHIEKLTELKTRGLEASWEEAAAGVQYEEEEGQDEVQNTWWHQQLPPLRTTSIVTG